MLHVWAQGQSQLTSTPFKKKNGISVLMPAHFEVESPYAAQASGLRQFFLGLQGTGLQVGHFALLTVRLEQPSHLSVKSTSF